MLAIADDTCLLRLRWLSYSFIGQRMRHDPPFCTSLVSQRMPLYLADRFCALLLFLSGGNVREDCFVVKMLGSVVGDLPDSNSIETKRSELVAERTRSVNTFLTALTVEFASPTHLLQSLGLQCELPAYVSSFNLVCPVEKRLQAYVRGRHAATYVYRINVSHADSAQTARDVDACLARVPRNWPLHVVVGTHLGLTG